MLAAEEDLQGAAQALSRLVEEYPDNRKARFFYASVLFRSGLFAEAVPHLEAVLGQEPTHEWASVCLFHSLWKTRRRKEAVAEIRRFFDAGGESMEYRRLLKDIQRALRDESE